MAATNGPYEGGPMLLYVDGVAVAFSTSVSYSFTHAPREIKNKTDGRWPRRKQGRMDLTGSCNLLYAMLDHDGNAIYNLEDVFDDIVAGSIVTLAISNTIAGDKSIGGDAIFTGMNQTFGDYGENAEGDFSFSCDDAWEFTTIT